MTRSASEKDLTLAWLHAANCALYEQDPGPAHLNVGSHYKPSWISRQDAFRDLYAHLLMEVLGADTARITAVESRIDRVGKMTPSAAEVWEIAADLCQRAHTLVDNAGATEDDCARRRLIAGTRHFNRSAVLQRWLPDRQAEVQDPNFVGPSALSGPVQ